jgi:hypothetical protein
MKERDLQQALSDLAKLLRLKAYHTYDSRRSEPGFPDLVIVGPGGVLFRELKSETGRVSPHQRAWIESLTAAGADAGIWRPADQHEGRVAAQLHQLRRPR